MVRTPKFSSPCSLSSTAIGTAFPALHQVSQRTQNKHEGGDKSLSQGGLRVRGHRARDHHRGRHSRTPHCLQSSKVGAMADIASPGSYRNPKVTGSPVGPVEAAGTQRRSEPKPNEPQRHHRNDDSACRKDTALIAANVPDNSGNHKREKKTKSQEGMTGGRGRRGDPRASPVQGRERGRRHRKSAMGRARPQAAPDADDATSTKTSHTDNISPQRLPPPEHVDPAVVHAIPLERGPHVACTSMCTQPMWMCGQHPPEPPPAPPPEAPQSSVTEATADDHHSDGVCGRKHRIRTRRSSFPSRPILPTWSAESTSSNVDSRAASPLTTATAAAAGSSEGGIDMSALTEVLSVATVAAMAHVGLDSSDATSPHSSASPLNPREPPPSEPESMIHHRHPATATAPAVAPASSPIPFANSSPFSPSSALPCSNPTGPSHSSQRYHHRHWHPPAQATASAVGATNGAPSSDIDDENISLSRRGLRAGAAEFHPPRSSTLDSLCELSPLGSGLAGDAAHSPSSEFSDTPGTIRPATAALAAGASIPMNRKLSVVNTATGARLSGVIGGLYRDQQQQQRDDLSTEGSPVASGVATSEMLAMNAAKASGSPHVSPDTLSMTDAMASSASLAMYRTQTPTRLSDSAVGADVVRYNRIAMPDSVANNEDWMLHLLVDQADDEDSEDDVPEESQLGLAWETGSTASSQMLRYSGQANGGYWGVDAPQPPRVLQHSDSRSPISEVHDVSLLASRGLSHGGDDVWGGGGIGQRESQDSEAYEDIWEVNSSAYEDSLDDAQVVWIEEQLHASENPDGFFF